jgi:hypothetical protein
MAISENLLKAIAVTAELTQTEYSIDAARVMAEDLAQYDEQQVLAALVKCRRELKSRLTIAEIISRIDDGRPGAEEAWAMIPKDEFSSVVWTSEMADAFGVCYKLIESGDTVQARMAFIESYKSRVNKARDAGEKVKWIPSLGHDKNSRESVLADAVMITPSAPTPFVCSSTNFTTSPFFGLNGRIPHFLARFNLLSSTSTPITLQPFAANNWAVSKPIRPNPVTTIVSPRVGLSNRIP